MEDVTKKILTLHTIDKRVTERKSANLEKVSFNNAMVELRNKGIKIKEVVTDAHLGIGALMSEFLWLDFNTTTFAFKIVINVWKK